jgi:molybdenum cofactor guanylyltransferase
MPSLTERPLKPFSAVLLAGGRSSRMGRNKVAVAIDGEPLWQRQLRTLRATGAEEVLISGPSNGPYAGAGARIVEDFAGGLGPIAGIAAALRQARHRRVLVLAIDLPAMPSRFLAGLVRESERAGCGIVPHGERGFESLAAVYLRECLPLAEAALHGEDRSLQRFVQAAIAAEFAAPREMLAEERPLFLNVNTPEDLLAFTALPEAAR